MRTTRHTLFFCFFGLFLFVGIQHSNAQCDYPVNFTAVKVADSNCDDGIITVTVGADTWSTSTSGYVRFRYRYSGPLSQDWNDMSSSQIQITGLASGDYTIEVQGSCLPNGWTGLSATSPAVTVGGSYIAMDPHLSVTQRPLRECNNGKITIIMQGGKGPYTVTYKNTSDTESTSIPDIASDGESYTVENLVAGTYEFVVMDDCGATISKSITLSDITETIAGGDYILETYKTALLGYSDWMQARFVAAAGSGFEIYMANFLAEFKDNFSISYSYRGTTYTNNIDIRTENGINYVYFKKPTGLTTTYMAEHPEEYFEFKLTHKGSCATEYTFRYNFREGQSTWTTSPPAIFFGSNKYVGEGGCAETTICVPIEKATTERNNLWAFIATPVRYTITSGNGIGGTTVASGTYNNWYDTQICHDLDIGNYNVQFTDADGRTWNQNFELKNNMSSIINGLRPGMAFYLKLDNRIQPDCDSYDDACVAYQRSYNFSATANMEGFYFEYLEVPEEFYFKKNTTRPVNNATVGSNYAYCNIVSNSDNSVPSPTNRYTHYHLFPGHYKIRVYNQNCGVELIDEFDIEEPQLIIDAEPVRECTGFSLTPAAPRVINGVYSGTYMKIPGTVNGKVGLIDYPKLKSDGITPDEGNTNGKLSMRIYAINGVYQGLSASEWKTVDGSNSLNFPAAGTYVVAFTTRTSLTGSVELMFREYTVTRVAMAWDYAKINAYACPNSENGVIINAKTLEGTATGPYTYKLERKKNGDTEYTEVALGSAATVQEGDLFLFNDEGVTNAEAATTVYRLTVTDGCPSGSQTIVYDNLVPTSTSDILKISGQRAACPDEEVVLTATYIGASTYTWEFSATGDDDSFTELTADAGSPHKYTIANFSPSDAGYYRVTCDINGCSSEEMKMQLIVAPELTVWTAGSSTDKTDWNDHNNWDVGAPAICTDVYIPGGMNYYPLLQEDAINECHYMYYMQGGQVGRTDLLNYERAYVQMDFGGTYQETGSKVNRPTSLTADPKDYLKFSKTNSPETLSRGQWHMLTVPLNQVYSGDLSFGAYPLTFISLFNRVVAKPGLKNNGYWTIPFANDGVLLNPAEGFALWVNNNTGELGYSDTGEQNGDPESIFTDASTRKMGLKHVNGIIEFPHFDNKMMTDAHRIEKYDGERSSFYYVYDNTTPAYGWASESPDVVPRDIDQATKLLENLTYPVANLANGTEFMIANPYMSALDFVNFYNDNSDLILPYYRVWDPGKSGFITYAITDGVPGGVTTDIGVDQYIPPLQGFFVTTGNATSANSNIEFNVANVSTIKASTSVNKLRSSEGERNIIRLRASNDVSNTTALIIQQADAVNTYNPKEDIHALFSGYSSVPQIFTMASDYATVINRINGSDITVPFGIKTSRQGLITLNLSGMNNYQAKKIEFVDVIADKRIDITDSESYEYVFNNSDTSGAITDRFFLSFMNSSTAIDKIEDDIHASINKGQIRVSSPSAEIIQIEIYDLQGCLLYSETPVGTHSVQINTAFNEGALLLRVLTGSHVKNVKLINNK